MFLLKWIVTFFTISFPKEYVLRALDLLIVTDFTGMAIVCIAFLI